MAKESIEVSEPDVPPLLDEFEPEEESPYLRRQKAVPVRRRRFSRRVVWTVFSLAVLLPVGATGFFLAEFALPSLLFMRKSADNIVLEGNRYISREEVLGVLGLPLTGNRRAGTNVFRVSL